MTPRAVGRVVLIAVAVGLLALVGATSGAAAAWAVPIGVAVSLLGEPPVAPRAVTALGGAVLAWAALGAGLAVSGSLAVGSAVAVTVLVAATGLLTLRERPMTTAGAVLVGGAVVLGGAQLAGGAGLADVAPAVGGLLLGLLPMQVGEVVAALRRSRGGPATDVDPAPSTSSGEPR